MHTCDITFKHILFSRNGIVLSESIVGLVSLGGGTLRIKKGVPALNLRLLSALTLDKAELNLIRGWLTGLRTQNPSLFSVEVGR